MIQNVLMNSHLNDRKVRQVLILIRMTLISATEGEQIRDNNAARGDSARARNGLPSSRGRTIPEESRFTIPVLGELCH